MNRLHHFLAELKRRRVYRAGVVYAAVAVGVWQIADVALPNLGLPESAVTLVLVLTILGFPVALVLAWAYELKPETPASTTGHAAASRRVAASGGGGGEGAPAGDRAGAPPPAPDSPTSAGRTAALEPRSIAVLPFDNMSSEEESAYFAEGVAEELTHALGRVPSLRVAARTSAFAFKGERLDVREIGSRLGVAHVVEGSVRRAGNRLRVTAQLIDARDGYHVWSERFEREMDDVFAIQDDIVEAVVHSLLTRMGSTPGSDDDLPTLSRADDLAAYDLYLRALHALRDFDGSAMISAVELCEKAIAIDPAFAPAHAALASGLTTLAMGFGSGSGREALQRAKAAAERAVELAPELPAAHVALALSRLYYDWAFSDARVSLERAVELNPSFVEAHRWAEFYWTYVEHDYEHAVSSLERARALDPLDGRIPVRRATVEYIFGHYATSEELYHSILAEQPDSPIAVLGLMDTLVRAGRTDEAMALADRIPTDDGTPDVVLGVTGVVYVLSGAPERARELLERLEDRGAQAYAAPFWRALLHAGLGELDEAFELLDQAVEEKDGGLLFLSVAPEIPGLRTDPRYPMVLRRMGLAHLIP